MHCRGVCTDKTETKHVDQLTAIILWIMMNKLIISWIILTNTICHVNTSYLDQILPKIETKHKPFDVNRFRANTKMTPETRKCLDNCFYFISHLLGNRKLMFCRIGITQEHIGIILCLPRLNYTSIIFLFINNNNY